VISFFLRGVSHECAVRTSHHREPAAADPATIAALMHCMHMSGILMRVPVGFANPVGGKA
jgi:hypothetical protein